MSHPIPGHDYTEKHNEETEKEYIQRVKRGFAKTRALKKKKEYPLQKLKRLIGESEKGRKDWKSMLGK